MKTEMIEKVERRFMNYRRGDDLISGPYKRPDRHPGAIELVVRPEGWEREDDSALLALHTDSRASNCVVPVLQGSEITLDQGIALLDARGLQWEALGNLPSVEVDISYPLEHDVTAKFGPCLMGSIAIMTPGYILWQICRAYRLIYEQEQEKVGTHGVWGHVLADLCIEALYPHASGWCEILVGS